VHFLKKVKIFYKVYFWRKPHNSVASMCSIVLGHSTMAEDVLIMFKVNKLLSSSVKEDMAGV